MTTAMTTRIHHADWTLSVRPGAPVLAAPIWTLRELRIGPTPRDEAYGRHLARTRGSTVVWGDEWRFATSGGLVSLLWSVPEREGPMPKDFGPTETVQLHVEKLDTEQAGFPVRAFDGQQLVASVNAPLRRPRCYQIAPDLSLVVDEGRLWGWRLERPQAHLPGGPGPRGLTPLLARWCELIREARIDELEEGEAKIHTELTELRDRARALRHPSADAVADEVEAVLDNFYG